MKGLELLEKYENKYTFASQFNGDRLPDYQTRKMLEPIERELHALEIIRKLDCFTFYEIDNQYYVSGISVSKEEYELLKEVLTNEEKISGD